MSDNRNVSENQFGNNVVVIQGDNNATFNIASAEEDSSWLKKISQTNPAYDKKRIFESKGPFLYESFRWILDNSDFNRWRNTEKSDVFWIKGDPGKGKTMLLGGLVDDFEQRPQIGINLAYFFCQATDSRINTAAAVIGGLIVSFIKQHHELRSYIRTKYKDDLDKLNGPDKWYILRDMFEKVTQHSALPNPVCIVDALDECEQEHGCKQLLRLIIETSCHVKWLISSRNITEIERELQEIDSSRMLSLELKENAEYVTKSVDLYIDNSVQNIMALQGDGNLQTRATSTLKSKANGTFLWVALVIGQLRHTKHRDIEDVLEEMPEGLESLYSLILNRLSKQKDKDVYQILLSTVAAAERPLRLEELLTFISFQWKDYKTTYSLRDIQDIVNDCGSFLSIRDNTVYFIHQSVKDYMMGPAVRVIFPSGIEYQHYKMFTTSLNAMSRILKHDIYSLQDPGSDIKTISPPDPDPLAPIAYCCVFWIEHLFQSCESGTSRDKIFLKDGRILHSFLKVKYLCWLESLALLRSLVPQGEAAIQKLKNLISGYYKCDANRRHVGGSANPRGKRKKNRYRLIRCYKDLPFGTYIDYAYTFLNSRGNDSQLRAFIDDAYHFFFYHKSLVHAYPLQLYYSAIPFEDTHSAIHTNFQQAIRTEFENAPACNKTPQKQFCLVQNIRLNCHDRIIALYYSPDSSFLCSLSSGGTISLFRTDIYTLQWVVQLNTGKDNAYRLSWNLDRHFLAFSMNSKHLASISSRGVVQAWAVDCGTQMQNFSLDLNTSLIPNLGTSMDLNTDIRLGPCQVEVIALSFYGDVAASTCRSLLGAVSLVKIWTMKAGECITVIDRSHAPDIFHAAFSPSSVMLVLTNGENARVYSVQTGKEMKHISYPANSRNYVREEGIRCRFSPDSKLLALECGGDIYLCRTETWTMVRHIKGEIGQGQYRFSFSPDATMSVCEFSYGFLFESMDTGETLLRIQPQPYVQGYNPIFSPDWTQSSLFASSSEDAVQVWRVYKSTGAKSSKINATPLGAIQMSVSPKSKYVTAWDGSGKIEIWSGESGECIQILQGEEIFWYSPFFSPDLERVACVQGGKGEIQIWHVKTGKPLHLLEGLGAECHMVHTYFSDDSRYIVAGFSTGQVKVWCVESGKRLYETRVDDDTSISEVVFSPGARYIASASVSLQDGRTSTDTITSLYSDTIASSYSDTIASSCSDIVTPFTYSIALATVRVWDWRTGHCISRTDLMCTLDFLTIAFSSDATVVIVIIYSSSPHRSPHRPYDAKFYDISSGACLGDLDLGESNHVPLYDPAKDHIVSDRFRFCKGSSWKHWDTISQPSYSYSMDWIHFGEHKAFQIPKHILLSGRLGRVIISDSLLTFKNNAGQVLVIKLPSRFPIEQ